MTPEELKLSELSSELTLADRGLTPQAVMRLTGREPRPVRTIVDIEKPRRERPESTLPIVATPADRHAAAVKVVDLARGGLSARAALAQTGLSESYAHAVHQCLTDGPLLAEARAGATQRLNKGITFIRWWLNLPTINGADSPDNEKLRKLLRRTALTANEISKRSGICLTNIYAFRAGSLLRMKAASRDAIFAALN